MKKRKSRTYGDPLMHDVVIFKSGEVEDCVHHEVIVVLQDKAGTLVGTCQKCGQVRHYEDRLFKKVAKHANATEG